MREKELTQLSISEQINWHIKNYYIENIKWLKNWIDFSENQVLDLDGQKIQMKINILFTSYESFLANKTEFIDKILY